MLRISLCGSIVLLCAWASVVVAQEKKLSLADLIEQSEPACVRIDVTLARGKSIGSGFLVEKRNWVVTNHHVAAGALKAVVTFADNSKIDVAGVLAYDKDRDVAVLQLASDAKAAPLTLAAKTPRKGESTVAIGAPSGLSFTATEGIVSAIRDGAELKSFGQDAVGTWLQTSTPISPGSSGGPLLNMQGEVVGANSGSLAEAQNLNFAVSSTDIQIVLRQASSNKLQELASIAPRERPSSSTVRPRPGRPESPGSPPREAVVCKLPAERKFTHRFKVGKEQDEFDKITYMRTEWMPLRHGDQRLTACALRVSSLHREDSPAPVVVWEVGTASKTFAFIGLNSRRFQLLVDGQSNSLNEPSHKGDVGRGGVTETLTTAMRLDKFLEMIMAKQVKARVGELEYELSADQLECLRDLASRLPVGESVEDVLKVERYALEDDPSAPLSLVKAAKAKAAKASKAEDKPDHRLWKTADGKYTVEARLVSADAEKVTLSRKDNGNEITVPRDKLSKADQLFLRAQAIK